MVRTGSWLIVGLGLVASLASAAPTVEATVDSNNISQGEVVQLNISVSSDSQMSIDDVRLPPLDGFDLLNSSVSQSARQSIVGDEMETVISQNYTYILQPNKTGKLTIPSVEVSVNNQGYKTKPIQVTVTTGGGRVQPRPRGQPQIQEEDDPFFEDQDSLFQQLLKRHGLGGPRGPPPKINPDEAFFIQLDADKNEAYVGEQVTASWYIYTRNGIQNIDTLKYPNLKAFYKEDIEVATRLDWRQEVINGIPYRKALLVSYALFPMKEGMALIDSYKARCTVLMGGGPFNMGQSYTFTKASQEVKVKVKPVPTVGRPADYSGGVGQFQVRTSVDQPNVAVNQPFAFKIRLEGRGNAKSIDLPSMDLPKSLENYSQRDESKFNRDGTSFKEFEILLIPRETGKVIIPKITMSFFDPVRGSFYTQSTNPIELNVGIGKGGSNNPSVNPTLDSNVSAVTAKKTNPELMTQWESYHPRSMFEKFFWWLLVFVVAIIFGAWRFVTELQIGAKKKSIFATMQKRLKVAQSFIGKGDWRRAGSELTNAIYLVVGSVAGEEGGASIELDRLFEHLAPSLRKEFEASIQAQLRRCETLSFAPESVVGNQKEHSELLKLKSDVESLLGKFIKAASAVEDKPQ